MKTINIFNIPQAQTFIRHGCKVVDITMGKRAKVAIVFERDAVLETMLQRWHNKEFIIEDVKGRY